MTFGGKLKKLRTDSGLTQDELAEKIYVTRTAVSKWESDRGYPNIDSLKAIINCRPTFIDGYLEASYPSSTTMLVMCVMLTAMIELHTRIKNKKSRRCTKIAIAVFSAFMVIGRLVSGVHWITDIIGGVLVSIGLVIMYASVNDILK